MEQIKLDYLKNNLGFHYEDLTTARKIDFRAYPKPIEWKLVALSEGNLNDWNGTNGFRIWNQAAFRERVEKKLKLIEEMPIEDFLPSPLKSSSIGKGKELTMDAATLSRYPRDVWFWCNEDHIKSKKTNKIFRIIGGKEWFDKFISGKTDLNVPTDKFWWDGEKWNTPESKGEKIIPNISIDWHRQTKFRKIREVYDEAREIYDEWVKLGWIPADKQIGAPAISEKKKNGFLLD